jgi:CheY-like chemotaxis protein
LGLPDGTGIDLFAELKSQYGLKGIAVSGYGMEDDVQRCLAAGFAAHVTKPINLDRLDDLIQEVAGQCVA